MDPGLLREDMAALQEGVSNLKKHIENLRYFGIPVIVSINVFLSDTARELEFLKKKALEFGANDCQENRAWQEGSRGALALAKSVLECTHRQESTFKFLYEDGAPLKEKIETIATKIYGAGSVEYSPVAVEALDFYTKEGFGRLPVCIAKTQFSLSSNEALKGAPTGFVLPIKDVRLCSGAGFILAHTSTMQTMPGLPRLPRGAEVNVSDSGTVTGLT